MNWSPEAAAKTLGTFRALGHTFDISVDSSDHADKLRWAMSTLAEPITAEHHYRLAAGPIDHPFRVMLDGHILADHVSLADALDSLFKDINKQAIQSRPGRLGLHAAAVSWKGQGIVLPGPSGAGKSTMAAALASAGCDYLTDEAAFIDLETSLIEPYPKPISVKATSSGVSFIRPDSVGHPARVRVIALTTYAEGGDLRLLPVSRAETLIEVANNSFNFVHHGGAWLHTLARIVEGATCWRLQTGDPLAAARLLMDVATRSSGEGGVERHEPRG